MRGWLALAMLVGLACPAFAEEDPMEVQRCVWRCLADSKGAGDPVYAACVSQRCNGEPEEPQPSRTRTREGAASQAGTWTYGRHPVLGRSAYVEIPGGGAIGLSCLYSGPDPVDEMLSLRVTDEVFEGDVLTYFFQNSGGAGSIDRSPGEAFTEERGNTCRVDLHGFRTDEAVVLIDGRIESIDSGSGETQIKIATPSKSAVVTTANEAKEKLGGRSIPLKGSAKAIAKLLAQCPAARLDIENNCGI